MTSTTDKRKALKKRRNQPQNAVQPQKLQKAAWVALELLLGAYFVVITAIALKHGQWVTGFFLGLFMVGYLWVGCASLASGRRVATT